MATNAPARAAEVHIQRLELPHVAQAAVVLERAFDNEYSWSRPLQMPTERFRFWIAQMYLPERAACSAPASLVATREGGTSSEPVVAGVCTLEDFYAPEVPEAEDNPPPGMRAIDGILGECKLIFHGEALRRGLPVEKGRLRQVAYVAFLAVDNEVRRHRVGHRLVEQAVGQLSRDGFTVVVAFCTSYKSRALFQGAGFERWGGVSYQTYTIDGATPFASLPKDECAVLVWTAHKAI